SEMVEDTDSREEASFTLHEERPVVSKKEVPVEEVRVRKRDGTRQEHVEGERRTERIELGEDDLDEEAGTRESWLWLPRSRLLSPNSFGASSFFVVRRESFTSTLDHRGTTITQVSGMRFPC